MSGELVHLVSVGILFLAIWVAGELFALAKAQLVGQIIVGMILGPGLLDFVPHHEAFSLVGLLGLLLLVEGGGLHMDLQTMRIVGWKALCVGLTGTFLPILFGWALLALLGFGQLEGYLLSLKAFVFISHFITGFSKSCSRHSARSLLHWHSTQIVAAGQPSAHTTGLSYYYCCYA